MRKRHFRDKPRVRSCLKCGRSFLSWHRFNRLCENCSRQNANINHEVFVFGRTVSSRKPMAA